MHHQIISIQIFFSFTLIILTLLNIAVRSFVNHNKELVKANWNLVKTNKPEIITGYYFSRSNITGIFIFGQNKNTTTRKHPSGKNSTKKTALFDDHVYVYRSLITDLGFWGTYIRRSGCPLLKDFNVVFQKTFLNNVNEL